MWKADYLEDVRGRHHAYLRENGIYQRTLAEDIGYSDAMVSLWLRSTSNSMVVANRMDGWLPDRSSLSRLKDVPTSQVGNEAQAAGKLLLKPSFS